MDKIAQIDAQIGVLKARIQLLETQKEYLLEKKKLQDRGWFLAADFAKHKGVSRAYIGNNKAKWETMMLGGKQYFKLD